MIRCYRSELEGGLTEKIETARAKIESLQSDILELQKRRLALPGLIAENEKELAKLEKGQQLDTIAPLIEKAVKILKTLQDNGVDIQGLLK
jgi:predicted  nucleic acid-binding Zn-ribbon protein